MEKVLIIGTLWPPNYATGMYRTKGFVDHLHKYGYQPVLATLNWSENQPESDYIVEDYNGAEIFKAKYKESLTEKINKTLTKKLLFVRRLYNISDRILWANGIWTLYEHNKLLKLSKIILKKYPDIKKAIVITEPYQLHYIGYYLNKKYGVNWIADYRDAWNTMEFHESSVPESKLGVMLRPFLEHKAEKKWVGTAKYVTSVSDHYSKQIADFVKIPYKTIYNGFFESELKLYRSKQANGRIVIVYNGTLYSKNQNVNIFLDGLKSFINHNKDIDIEVRFIGAGVRPEACDAISSNMKGYEQYYHITKRIDKLSLINEINNADFLLLISHSKRYKGVATSKIFDYFASRKPVICCPGDGDIVEALLTESGQGFFANSSEEVEQLLSSLIDQIQKEGSVKYNFNLQEIMKYSRENQTKQMASLLDTL